MNPGAGSARQDGAVHPVLNLIRTRMAAGSRPLHRDDDARLAVVLEGGSSRAAHGGSMICELEERGLLAAFDAVYGSSAGALNGAWLVCERARANVHGWWISESMGAIMKPGNLWRGQPVVDGEHIADVVYETVTPIGFDEILASPVEFHPAGTDAADVTLAQLHGDAGGPYTGCEEVWCLDHENIPVPCEIGLAEAAEWGEVHEEVGETLWPALYAWVESGNYTSVGRCLPSTSDFEERYCGQWERFDDFAAQLAEDTGLMDGWPEEAQRYFNWESWTRDLLFDHTVIPAPDGGVFVFRDL